MNRRTSSKSALSSVAPRHEPRKEPKRNTLRSRRSEPLPEMKFTAAKKRSV
jgi:hypothetical protein